MGGRITALAVRAAAAALLVACLAGCVGRPVRLNEIRTVETVSGGRANLPFVSGTLNPNYRLGLQDNIVFTATGGGVIQSVEARREGGADYSWSSTPLTVFRAPVSALETVMGVTLTISGSAPSAPEVWFCTPITCAPALAGRSVSDVLAALGRHPGISITVEPVEPVRPQPADTVYLTRDWQLLINPADPVFGGLVDQTERFELPVDEQGMITFPALATLAPSLHNVARDRLGAEAALEGATMRVRVAVPGRSRATQPTLALVAWCLSATAPGSSQRRDCLDLGITQAFANDQSGQIAIEHVRYRLEPGPRTWTIVDEQGNRATIPYRYGATIFSAVTDAYRTLDGRDLVGGIWNRAFITVIPQSTTIDREQEAPFYGNVVLENGAVASNIDRLLLMPGDTVHISRLEPGPPTRSSNPVN